jgi:RimJ/RimL family protein N-acetyltransferase
VEEGEKLVRRFRARYLTSEDFTLGVFSPDGQQLLGGTGFHLSQGPLRHRLAEIGMWIAGDAAGQGLGTAVLQAMLAWGFTEWPWERLLWRCRASNVASARVAEKAGLTLEGTARGYERLEDGSREDMLHYAILKHEWEALRTTP